jgi:hypothetical protein
MSNTPDATASGSVKFPCTSLVVDCLLSEERNSISAPAMAAPVPSITVPRIAVCS